MTGQFWRYDRTDRKLYLPDGTVSSYDASGRLTEIRDTFGNVVSLTGLGTNELHVVQQLGNGQSREVVVSPSSTSYAGRTWSYEWTTIVYGSVPVAVLSRVVPPVGPAWEYTCDSTDLVALKHLRTPSGGEIAYAYGIHQFGREQDVANQLVVNSRVVTSRAVVGERATNGTWTYTYRDGTPEDPCPCERTTIATPSGTSIEFRHEALGIGYVPTLGGDFGVTRRTVTNAQGQVLETETREYVTLPVVITSRLVAHRSSRTG